MKPLDILENSPGLTDVPGFTAEGVACNIRGTDPERLDLAIIHSDSPCSAAAVFTPHDLPAAPVQICRQQLKDNDAFHGIVVNSGNANACTGEDGVKDAQEIAALAAAACHAKPHSLFVCSTGRIGRMLPITTIREGIARAALSKGNDSAHGQRAAQAILTSDTYPKTITVRFKHNGQTVTLSAIAKGAGMIEPNMATMLAFIGTDAKLPNTLLHACLTQAVNQSFNAITVDGDMSTNDTVIALANGVSGVVISAEDTELLEMFQEALSTACKYLAKKIVQDGERVTKCVHLHVHGAQTQEDAKKVARCVANSLLVKTSWYGNDPNWGRIADAAGYAQVGIREDKLEISYDTVKAFDKGHLLENNLSQWKAIVSQPEFSIHIHLNLGEAAFSMLATDLTEGYVDFNKSE